MPSTFGKHSIRVQCGALAMWAMLLAACSHEPKVTIPLQENAAKQYAYAIDYRDSSNMELIRDTKRYLKVRAVVREHFKKVEEYFPGDRKATPLAKLEVADMDAGLNFARTATPPGEIRKGIKALQQLAADYPDYEFIQAKTLFDEGMCYLALHEFPKASECFRQVRDRFSRSPAKDIRDLARLAALRYNKSYTNE